MGNYIVFTLFLVVILIFTLTFWMAFSFFKIRTLVPESIAGYQELLSTGDYDKFPTAKILGEGSCIAVLDKEGNTVYDPNGMDLSRIAENLAFTRTFVEGMGVSYFTTDHMDSDGTSYYNFQISHENDGITRTDTYIFDAEGKTLYESPGAEYSNLTGDQALLLSQRMSDEYDIYKYVLDNQNILIIFQSKSLDMTILQRLSVALCDSLVLFLIIYIGMILGFVFWLKRKITKPLYILCGCIESYEIGNNVAVKYKGPREFSDILNSFSELAAKLSMSEREREALENEKRAILADIAHDLKTPITVIQGYTQALNAGLVPIDKQGQYLQTINQKANDLNNIINSFSEFSKLDHPEFKLETADIDICDYFRTYLANKYFEIESAGFVPDAEIPEETVYAAVDEHQLQRVFDNVIGNALKHNPKGTRLYFALVNMGKTVELYISDNGVGIPDEMAKKIFLPFVVGENSRKGSGSGLGLAISQKIVDAHGGDICLIRNSGEWKTTFRITLPTVEKSEKPRLKMS